MENFVPMNKELRNKWFEFYKNYDPTFSKWASHETLKTITKESLINILLAKCLECDSTREELLKLKDNA